MPYKIEVDSTKKSVFLSTWGQVTPTEGQTCIKEFVNKTSNINQSDYTLILDGSNFEVVDESSAPMFEQILKIYTSFPFKKRLLIKSKSVIAQSQIKRILRGGYNQYFTEVEDLETALKSV